MIVIIVLLLVILIVATIILMVNWMTHISMVKDSTDRYGWGNYKKFVREFNKREWSNENWSGSSLWGRNNNSKIYANIIQFNGIGMIINNPISYLLVCIHIRKFNKSINNRKYKW